MKVTDSIEDIERELAEVNGDTLVVFDCDEVLTTLSENVWKDRNREFLLEWCGKNIENFSDQALYDLATSILMATENFLVSDRMPGLVNSLRDKGAKAVVLTALSTKPLGHISDPMSWRLKTLINFGYNFAKYWKELHPKIFDEFLCEYPPEYRSGVICSGDVPKSGSLGAFLGYSKCSPKKVIFIDDLQENLDDVEFFCKSKGLEFVGVQYKEAERITSSVPFCPKTLECQLATFQTKKVWISDVDALNFKFEFPAESTLRTRSQVHFY